MQAGEREKYRHEKTDNQAAQLLADVTAQDRGLTNQNSSDESSQHRMNAYRIGRERHHAHDDQNCGDDGRLAHKRIVRPANQTEHQPATDCEACQQKQSSSEHASHQACHAYHTVQRQA